MKTRHLIMGIFGKRFRRLICWVLFFGALETGFAATWYVAVTGNETAAGTNGWDSALLSISNAIGKCAHDDTIMVSGGVYKITATLNINKNVRLLGVDGRGATFIDGNYPVSTLQAMIIRARAEVSGFTISNAVNPGDYGGGVYMTNGILFDCVVSNCSVKRYGGGISLGVAAVVSNCTVIGNVATQNTGGGIAIGAGGIVHSCQIEANSSFGSSGGIDMAAGSTAINCMVIGNLATNSGANYGGGILLRSGASIQQCSIISNSCAYGGGLSLYEGGSALNCLVAGNNASLGGGIHVRQHGHIKSCTIADNRAASLGGGVYLLKVAEPNDLLVYNSIIYNNSDSGGSYSNYYSGAGVWSHCCTAPTLAGDNIITDNPRFVAPAEQDFHLQGASRCIDAGFNEEWMRSATDLDGRCRINVIFGIADIGCYEYAPRGATFRFR